MLSQRLIVEFTDLIQRATVLSDNPLPRVSSLDSGEYVIHGSKIHITSR